MNTIGPIIVPSSPYRWKKELRKEEKGSKICIQSGSSHVNKAAESSKYPKFKCMQIPPDSYVQKKQSHKPKSDNTCSQTQADGLVPSSHFANY